MNLYERKLLRKAKEIPSDELYSMFFDTLYIIRTNSYKTEYKFPAKDLRNKKMIVLGKRDCGDIYLISDSCFDLTITTPSNVEIHRDVMCIWFVNRVCIYVKPDYQLIIGEPKCKDK